MLKIAPMQAQIDGNVVRAKFTLPPRQKLSPPPKPISAAPKRDAPKTDNPSADAEKDGPKRQRERMPCIRLLSLHILFILYNYHELLSVFTILVDDVSFSPSETSGFTSKKVACCSKGWIPKTSAGFSATKACRFSWSSPSRVSLSSW